MTSGPDADLFHGSQNARRDGVSDSSAIKDDRVVLEPGTIYAVSEMGADLLIGMGAEHPLIQADVQLVSLSPGWMFSG